MFTEKEIAYLQSQRLGRLATVAPTQQPDVAPVSFEFDGTYFYIGGFDITRTLKYKNVLAGQQQVAFVVDDLASMDPWTPRGIKLHGTAEIVERPGSYGTPTKLRITPLRSWSWGIEEAAFKDGKPVSNKAKQQV
jgi:pyridoxamine 5'-phosphate oxidase family protein